MGGDSVSPAAASPGARGRRSPAAPSPARRRCPPGSPAAEAGGRRSPAPSGSAPRGRSAPSGTASRGRGSPASGSPSGLPSGSGASSGSPSGLPSDPDPVLSSRDPSAFVRRQNGRVHVSTIRRLQHDCYTRNDCHDAVRRLTELALHLQYARFDQTLTVREIPGGCGVSKFRIPFFCLFFALRS